MPTSLQRSVRPQPAEATLAPPATEVVRQRFSVPFEYSVVFTEHAFAPENLALVETLTAGEPHRRHRVLVVIDAGVEAAFPELRTQLHRYFERHAARMELAAEPHAVKAGEAAKNDPELVTELHALFHRHHIDRHSFVLIVGGGAVLDAVGYAAGTAHRGLRTVRMPTTVLGQNDSGVGVKNGVNAFGAKNFLGTFVPPFAVINDAAFLERLPRRDRIAGFAEAVKVALIRDAGLFAWLEGHVEALAACEPLATAVLIRRCAELHLRQIAASGDPFERGSARPLDFGHWAAHKLEALTAHELRHGEAVAIGIALDTRYSVEAGLLTEAEDARVQRLLVQLGLPTFHEALLRRGGGPRLAVLDGLEEFREHLGGDLTITLLEAIGRGVEVHELDESKIISALGVLEATWRSRA